jgi:hypothetical protein
MDVEVLSKIALPPVQKGKVFGSQQWGLAFSCTIIKGGYYLLSTCRCKERIERYMCERNMSRIEAHPRTEDLYAINDPLNVIISVSVASSTKVLASYVLFDKSAGFSCTFTAVILQYLYRFVRNTPKIPLLKLRFHTAR